MWSQILTVGLKVIDLFVSNIQKKEKLKKDFFRFVLAQDANVLDSAKLKSQYDGILEKIKEEDKA